MNLDDLMERIKKGDEIHLEERARLLMEIGGYGLGGIELGSLIKGGKINSKEKFQKLALGRVIQELCQDSGICYMNHRFRACVILLACITEAILSLELIKKGNGIGKDWTLGNLINYSQKNEIVPKIVVDAAKEVNNLRIIAVHLKIEREEPERAFSTSDFDKVVPLEDFKNPPVLINENGGISGDDVLVSFGIHGAGIIYKFKKAAELTYKNVKVILTNLYGLSFK